MSKLYIFRFIFLGNVIPIGLTTCGIVFSIINPSIEMILAFSGLYIIAFIYMINSSVNKYIRAGPFKRETNEYKSIIGGGWSHFLQKNGSVNASFDRTHGQVTDNWWRAGTTIGQVQKTLQKQGRTFASHPSIKTSTLGGWIFSNSHGSGGTLWTPQFKRIKILDQNNNQESIVTPKILFNSHRTLQEQRRYIIKEVEIQHVENVWTLKTAMKMKNEGDVHTFLTDPSYLRLAQIGRRGTLFILWKPCNCENIYNIHTDPHFFSKPSLWFQADVLSAWQGKSKSEDWFDFPIESQDKWTSYVKLNVANDFTPSPIAFLGSFAFSYKNFEVFVDIRVTSKLVYTVCRAIEVIMIKVKGRCELRCAANKLFLDFGVPTSADTGIIFRSLKKIIGNMPIQLHKGKAQVCALPFSLQAV